MKNNKKLLLLFLICYTLRAFSGIGYGNDWRINRNNVTIFESEFGFSITDNKDILLVEDVCDFYYYKNHIIGKYSEDNEITNAYFVVNDKTAATKVFKTQKEWENFLKTNNLKPKIWTRWSPYPQIDSFSLVLLAILFIIIVFLTFITYKVTNHAFKFKKVVCNLGLLFLIFIGVVYLLDIFPQSL